MKNRIIMITGLLLLFTGACLMMYPVVCKMIYKMQMKQTIESFTEWAGINSDSAVSAEVKTIEPSFEAIYQLMVQYNIDLYNEKQKNLVGSLSYQQAAFSLSEFDFEDEMIGYISIPKMDIQLPLYLGANDDNMKKGAAHLTNTTLPIGGENTNAVIAAHRGMTTAAMFRDIEKLEIGDEVFIVNFHDVLTYKVVEMEIISPSDIEKILIQPGRDLITLLTCHPYRHNYQRYIVYCESTV